MESSAHVLSVADVLVEDIVAWAGPTVQRYLTDPAHLTGVADGRHHAGELTGDVGAGGLIHEFGDSSGLVLGDPIRATAPTSR